MTKTENCSVCLTRGLEAATILPKGRALLKNLPKGRALLKKERSYLDGWFIPFVRGN